MAEVCKSLLAGCISCNDVYHLWEKEKYYDFAVLCNIDSRYDNITGHEVRLLFVCNIAVISVLEMPSLRIYQ